MHAAQEYFTHMETTLLLVKGSKSNRMVGAQGLRAGRDLYRATSAVTRGLDFPVPSEGQPHLVTSCDTQGDVKDLQKTYK